MKILFVAKNMNIGGIQVALINLLKTLSKRANLQIDLFTFSGGELHSQVPENVTVYIGGTMLQLAATSFNDVKKQNQPIKLLLRILCMLWVKFMGSKHFYSSLFACQKKFSDYDIAISYFNDDTKSRFPGGTNLFADRFVGARRKVAWIHTDPELAGFDMDYCKDLYKDFDRIVCVSKACKIKLESMLPEYASKMRVLYNSFPKDEIIRKSTEQLPFVMSKEVLNIITVGRIDNRTKRIIDIIDLCIRLKNNGYNEFVWRIVGDGPDLDMCKKYITDNQVGDLVELYGGVLNVYPFIKQSDLFVLISHYEGYPMVIGEALLLGTYIFTSHYAAAPEQIKSIKQGIIFDDPDELYELLVNRLNDRTGSV